MPSHSANTASPPSACHVALLRSLIAAGILALLFFGSWIVTPDAFREPILLAAFLATLPYVAGQMLCSWYFYLIARRRAPLPRPDGLTVDVYVTACREPLPMVEKALAAACRLHGPHRTYLLDDGGDPELKRLADDLGAGYLTRADRRDAKAGNLNAALPRTNGDVVAIFDIDHVPAPDFLERSLGPFADPEVGFVQVMLTFEPEAPRWVAHAATETSLDFYNPTSIGMDAIDSVTMMGSNSILRRAALESIGGYRPGLAEDLATSLALHASGWKSAYIAEPLAPGMAPADVAAWFTQQLKWARGVFEVMLADLPGALPRLRAGQRAAYAVRMTNYWLGPIAAMYLAITAAALLRRDGGDLAAALQRLLLHMAPLMAVLLAIRAAAMAAWRHPAVAKRPVWRALALVYFTWPVYTLAWTMALLRRRLPFLPTPKSGTDSVPLTWLAPQALGCAALAGAGLFATAPGLGAGWSALERAPVVAAFAAVQALLPLVVFLQRLHPKRLQGIAEAAHHRRVAASREAAAWQGQ